MAVYKDDSNEYASKGVGTAGLTLGVIGTALASGILGGGPIGGLFGAQRPDMNPMANPVYQLAQKDNEIAILKAQQYADNKVAALTERVSGLEARVYADEKTDPLRDQILGDRIAGLSAIVNRISAPMVPNYAVAPGWGPTMVAPLPPPFPPVSPTTTTSAPATSTTGNG